MLEAPTGERERLRERKKSHSCVGVPTNSPSSCNNNNVPFVYTEQALANTTTDLKCPQEVLPIESVRERLAKSHMWSLANTSKDSERREAISHAQVLLHNCECSES